MTSSPLSAQRFRALSLSEGLLDIAALAAITVEVVRILSTGFWPMIPVLALGTAAVLGRRRRPVSASVAAILVSVVVLFAPASALPVWVLAEVVLFSLAVRSRRTSAVCGAALHGVVLYVGAIIVFGAAPYEPVALILPVWTVAVVATGLALRANDERMRALEERARSATAYRDSEVRRHVADERMRIARDLHDSVAHTASIISIHAGAAERNLERDPAKARDSLHHVREMSRSVIDELQEILAVLRTNGDGQSTEAVPGVDALDSLVDTARRTGMTVDFAHDSLADLDRAAGVALFRIVQESLTNARKYGNGVAAVRVERLEGRISVIITNPISSSAQGGDGFGLLGMRERASSAHGWLEARPDGDEFVVRAMFPLHQRPRE